MTTPQNRTSAKAWKKRSGGTEVEMPSGNVALIKRPGMPELLKAGIMPDSLTPIALEHIRRAEAGGRPNKGGKDDADLDAQIMEKVLQDPEEMTDIFRSFDRVTAMCVVAPKVLLHFKDLLDDDGKPVLDEKGRRQYVDIPDEERLSSEVDEGSEFYVDEENEPIYTDQVDPDDKQFIFRYVVSGDTDLESFRREQAAALAGA